MKTQLTIAALFAACSLGLAHAQTTSSTTPTDPNAKQAPTSTPGAGCTATANAMRGGNLGGSATNKDCAPGGTPTAATSTGSSTMGSTASSGTSAPMASGSSSSTMSSSSGSTDTSAKPMRVARADRG